MGFKVISPVALHKEGQFGIYALNEIDESTTPPTIRIVGYVVIDTETGAVMNMGDWAQCLKVAKEFLNEKVRQDRRTRPNHRMP